MAKEALQGRKTDLINKILDIELYWFLTLNPTATSECQKHPEAFRLTRSSTFETWSEETLALYLEHLADAQSKGRNLMREKYAKIQKSIPRENYSDILRKSVEIYEGWQQEAREEYPGIFREETGAGPWYLRCELDTYSVAVLESYLNDQKAASVEGRNLVIETYGRIARKIGYSSLEQWHEKLQLKRRGNGSKLDSR